MEQRPNIYFFNPTCEYAVANGNTSWQPNRLLQKMEDDLGTLPMFFARPNDIVLLRKLPSENFLQKLVNQGIPLPRFVLLQEAQKNKLNGEKINHLLPWGWSPAVHKLLEPLKENCTADFLNSPVSSWKPVNRDFYSKKFALSILQNLLPLLPREKTLPPEMLPRVVTSKSEIKHLIESHGKLMLKAPWGSSGRGLQPITKIPVVPKVWEKLMGIINEQGYAIAEPLLDKVLDMSLQFELKRGQISYAGRSIFLTDKKGQYQGNYLNSLPENRISETRQFAEDLPEILKQPLLKILNESPLPRHYEGVFGVDTLVYRENGGKLRANPCLEINLRQNMGLLSLHLEKLMAPKAKGMFKTFYQKNTSFMAFANEMENKYPAITDNGKMAKGFFALTESGTDAQFGAYIILE